MCFASSLTVEANLHPRRGSVPVLSTFPLDQHRSHMVLVQKPTVTDRPVNFSMNLLLSAQQSVSLLFDYQKAVITGRQPITQDHALHLSSTAVEPGSEAETCRLSPYKLLGVKGVSLLVSSASRPSKEVSQLLTSPWVTLTAHFVTEPSFGRPSVLHPSAWTRETHHSHPFSQRSHWDEELVPDTRAGCAAVLSSGHTSRL